MSLTITIGWTLHEDGEDYSSFSDGYQPGRRQHEEAFIIDGYTLGRSPAHGVDEVAGMVYEASNCLGAFGPDGYRVLDKIYASSLPSLIAQAIEETGYTGRIDEAGVHGHFSLSVGDTVTVDGVMLEVAPFGFKPVQEQCSWGTGGDLSNGCDDWSTGEDGLCDRHRKAEALLLRAEQALDAVQQHDEASR